jgi:hypothetical protein
MRTSPLAPLHERGGQAGTPGGLALMKTLIVLMVALQLMGCEQPEMNDLKPGHKRVHFEDKGQALLWWHIDHKGIIRNTNADECRWVGVEVPNHEYLFVNSTAAFRMEGGVYELKYRIVHIEEGGVR